MSLAGKMASSRSIGDSTDKAEEQGSGVALAQLKALGPLGVGPSTSALVSATDGLQPEGDLFASALVQLAFADTPVTVLGELHCLIPQCMRCS